MAKAEKTTTRVERVVTEDVNAVVLTLDENEVQVLLTVLAKVGGPRNKRRGVLDGIRKALEANGYYYKRTDLEGIEGNIYLDDGGY